MRRSRSPLSSVGRPAERKSRLVRELRSRIVSGQLAPGGRLPTRQEIEQEFGLSSDTVQSALSDLIQDGFVKSRGRNGTFVSETPPHLNRYALAFGQESEPDIQLRFWKSLAGVAGRVAAAFDREIALYYGLDSRHETEDYQRLYDEAESHRIAGIIFPTAPHSIADTPILNEPGIPRVAIASERLYDAPDIPVISPDGEALFERALRELQSRGRKSLAVLMPWLPETRHVRTVAAMKRRTAEMGFDTRPYWWHFTDHHRQEAFATLTHLMFNPRQQERPDALFISDDNFVEPVTRGLAEAGVSVPEEVDVIAHCNFPYIPMAHLQPTYLGFDAEEMLVQCVRCIDLQRSGTPVEPFQRLNPRFQWEPPFQLKPQTS